MGRTRLRYTDEYGDLDLFAEAMSKPWSQIVVDTSTIPDRAGRTREEVRSRLRRAFEHNGWSIVESGE